MDENIIPPRGNMAPEKSDSQIVPPRRPQSDENSNEIPRETLIPPRSGQTEEVQQPEEPKFVPKLSKLQFFAELALVFLAFDVFPFLLTLIDIGVITAFFIEPLKWLIAPFAWGTLLARAFFLNIPSPKKNKIGGILKKTIAPIVEMTPVINGFIPGWTFQYIIIFTPVTFDIKKIIEKGGKIAKFLKWIPGAEAMIDKATETEKRQ